MELTINDGTKTVMMILGSDTEEHSEMKEMFQDSAKLGRYAEYLMADPNRDFDIAEIRNL